MLILIHRSSIDDMRESIKGLAIELVNKYETGIRYTDRAIHIDTSLTHKHIDILGRCGNAEKCAGLSPDFWYTDRKDMDLLFKCRAVKVYGIKLNDCRDILKIVDILVKDGVKKCRL